jgi:hypothetical protein
MTTPLTPPDVILSRPQTIESPLGGSCSTMGDLREEHAPVAPVGHGHPRPTLTLADACLIAAERGGVCLSDTYVNTQALMHANLLCEQICGGAGPATSGAQLSTMFATWTRGARSVRALPR